MIREVGIPDSILFKRGPLTPEERAIMQEHPEKGYRIASSSPELAPPLRALFCVIMNGGMAKAIRWVLKEKIFRWSVAS